MIVRRLTLAFGRVFLLAGIAVSTFGSAAAAQSPAPGFRQDRTREGCLFFAPATAATDWSFTWRGSCTPGQVIDGQGTLEGSGPQGFTPRMSGQMIGGYFHGPITLVSIYPAVPGRPAMQETQRFQYNMGCNVTWTHCRPPSQPRSAPRAVPVARAPASTPPPARGATLTQAQREARQAEGRRLAATPAVLAALRDPDRPYAIAAIDRPPTPAERALANEVRRQCQSGLGEIFAVVYADWGSVDAALLDVDKALVNTARTAARPNASETLRMAASEGRFAFQRCAAGHLLARLDGQEGGASGAATAEAAGGPTASAGTSSSPPRERETVDTDNYARCLRALVPGRDAGAGNFGAVENSCDVRIAYTLCNLNPRPGSWGESFRCEPGARPGYLEIVGPNARASTHVAGAEAVYFHACRAPATPREATFQPGRGIIASCR